MQVNLYYEISAIVISTLILVYFGTTKKASDFHNRVFFALIFVNLLTAVFDIWNKYAIEIGIQGSMLSMTTFAYFIFHVATLPLFFFYVLTMVKNWYELSVRFKITISIPLFIGLLTIILNPITNFLYRYEGATYIRGDGYLALYITVAFYALLLIYVIFRYSEFFSISRKAILLVSIALTFVSMAWQLVDSNARVETFGIAFALLMMFLVIQNPHDQTDFETGLYNKNAFFSVMEQNVSAKRKFNILEIYVSDYASLISSDENADDIIPVQIAKLLRSLESGVDIYRINEKTFCVEFRGVSYEKIDDYIHAVYRRFEKPWSYGEYEMLYTLKMCHIAIPEQVDTFAKFMGIIMGLPTRHSDKTLYTIEDFNLSEMERELRSGAAIVKALDEDRVELIYSPICNVQSQNIVAVDTSIRISDGDIGLISAEEIINYMDKNGQTLAFSKRMFEKLCKSLADNNIQNLGVSFVCFQIPVIACMNMEYFDFIVDCVRKYKLNSRGICFGISEYAVSRAEKNLESVIDKFHRFGFSFCLYDYGSGYTNLASIYELSFDIVKISREIVDASYVNEKARITLDSTIDLARDLDMLTLIGGVDNEEYLDMVGKIGCEYASGMYFLEGISEKDFIDILIGQENVLSVETNHNQWVKNTFSGIGELLTSSFKNSNFRNSNFRNSNFRNSSNRNTNSKGGKV